MATIAVTLPKPPNPPRRRTVNPLVAGRARFTEFYFTKHIDNSRLVREPGLEKWREYFNLLLSGVLVFLCGLVLSWQHLKCVQDGYEIEGLKAERVQLQKWNHHLRLSEAGLVDPQRIDTLARRDLGMVSPSPQQLIHWSGPGSSSLQQPDSAPVAPTSLTAEDDNRSEP